MCVPPAVERPADRSYATPSVAAGMDDTVRVARCGESKSLPSILQGPHSVRTCAVFATARPTSPPHDEFLRMGRTRTVPLVDSQMGLVVAGDRSVKCAHSHRLCPQMDRLPRGLVWIVCRRTFVPIRHRAEGAEAVEPHHLRQTSDPTSRYQG